MRAVVKKFNRLMLLLMGLLIVQDSLAAKMIDDFLFYQEIENGEDTTPIFTDGTQLINLTRTLKANPSNNSGADTGVIVDDFNGTLSIYNSSNSNGTVSILYSFDEINLSAEADALIFSLDFIDNKLHEIQLIANNTSIYGFVAMNTVGASTILFSQFSDPSVFNALTSLQVNLQGEAAWDAVYSSISAAKVSNVPEPSVIALLSIALVFMIRVPRKAHI